MEFRECHVLSVLLNYHQLNFMSSMIDHSSVIIDVAFIA